MGGDFVDLIVWQEAARLAAAVVSAVKTLRGPGSIAAAGQILRAAESIPANIAEGYGRGVGRDCVRFLRIARASASELESHLRVSRLAGRLEASLADELIDHARRVRYLIDRFLRSVELRSR